MSQMTFDSLTKERFYIDKPIRLIELFCGIGSQAKALKRLGVEFEHHIACDIDKFAIQSYNAVHGTEFETTDITTLQAADLKITDTDKYCYILTYSFPCQDLSQAGKRRGMGKECLNGFCEATTYLVNNSDVCPLCGGETGFNRSGLLWEVERIIADLDELPQVLLMENVPPVHGKDNIDSFCEWITFLESKGYTSLYKDLNAKDYGIPQNRDRCFMVSLLDGYYEFPEPVMLKETLDDRLEDESEIDEKYFLTDEQAKKVIVNTFNTERNRINDGGG